MTLATCRPVDLYKIIQTIFYLSTLYQTARSQRRSARTQRELKRPELSQDHLLRNTTAGVLYAFIIGDEHLSYELESIVDEGQRVLAFEIWGVIDGFSACILDIRRFGFFRAAHF